VSIIDQISQLEHSIPDVQIVYTKEHGDIIRIEFDVLLEEDAMDGVPNGT